MTISELIARLEELRAIHGDLPGHRPDRHVMSCAIRSGRFEPGRTVTAPDPFDPDVVHPDRIVIS